MRNEMLSNHACSYIFLGSAKDQAKIHAPAGEDCKLKGTTSASCSCRDCPASRPSPPRLLALRKLCCVTVQMCLPTWSGLHSAAVDSSGSVDVGSATSA